MTATGARYVVLCRGENEVIKYGRRKPASLVAELLRGEHPDWLVPVPMRPGESVKVYRGRLSEGVIICFGVAETEGERAGAAHSA